MKTDADNQKQDQQSRIPTMLKVRSTANRVVHLLKDSEAATKPPNIALYCSCVGER